MNSNFSPSEYEHLKKGERFKETYNFHVVMICSGLFIFFCLGLYIIYSQNTNSDSSHIFSIYHWHKSNHNEKKTMNHITVPQMPSDKSNERKFVICYYNVPNSNDSHINLIPSAIKPDLCSHINIAFANIDNKTINVDNKFLETIVELQKLKAINPNLKLLISVGGAGINSEFSEMVVDHASRKTFIKSIKYFLKKYNLDGVDLDWEFPNVHEDLIIIHKRERQHFSQLLREIRAEFIREKRSYLLTVAVAAPEPIVNAAYDVDQINAYVDFVNIMTYDFHVYSKYTPFTGLNSPLYPHSTEKYYLATLNINYTIDLYAQKGLEYSKMMVGIPTYGHSFRLANSGNGNIGSPAIGFGSIGSSGFVDFPDVCQFVKNNKQAILKRDSEAMVPYVHFGFEWISFDDQLSVLAKAHFIKRNSLGGAMIYSLNADDYQGICSELGQLNVFPLSQAVGRILRNDKL